MTDRFIGFSQFKGDEPVSTKLIGVGSAGCNMIQGSSLRTAALSTSGDDLERSSAGERLLISRERLLGLAQTDPALFKQMPSVVGDDLLRLVQGSDVVFGMACMGGASGSLGIPLVSSVARASGSMPVALVAKPFSAESERRRAFAERQMVKAMSAADLCIEFRNDELSLLAPHLPLSKAFSILNGIMHRPAMDLSSTVKRSDVKVLREAIGGDKWGRFGLGIGRGDGRVESVVDEALGSPWFDFDLADAGAAIAVYSASDPWDKEFGRILDRLQARIPEARIVHGWYVDGGLRDRIRLSLVLCRPPR